MKKTILPALILLSITAGSLQAQVDKGNVLLGGSVGYYRNSNVGNVVNSNAGFTPRVGYAIGRNSVINLTGSLSFGTQKSTGSDDKSTTNNYSVGLSWRRYFSLQNKLGWYAELEGGWATYNRKDNR